MRTVLIDDEERAIRSLSLELGNYCPDIEIIATFQSPMEALEELASLQVELVFLDVEMPEMDGFQFLSHQEQIDYEVIFVTAYNEYALKAFEFNAVDYILKPVRKAKLISAVQRVLNRQSPKLDVNSIEALISNYAAQRLESGLTKVALPSSDGFTMIPINDIFYLKAESNYTWVHITNGNKVLVSKTLKQFEEIFNFSFFFRPHKSYLVNLNHLEQYIRGDGGYLVMIKGIQIPVARSQKSDLLRLLRL